MKTCNKCSEAKVPEAFYLDRRTPDGRQYACKECVKGGARERYMADPQAHIDRTRLYASTHRESVLAQKRWYAKAHREEAKKRSREWRAANQERWLRTKREADQRARELLQGAYVKKLILRSRTLRARDVPTNLVEIKREQLRLHRLANEMHQAANQAKEDHESI